MDVDLTSSLIYQVNNGPYPRGKFIAPKHPSIMYLTAKIAVHGFYFIDVTPWSQILIPTGLKYH